MKRSCLNVEEGEPNVNLILKMSRDVSEEFIIALPFFFFFFGERFMIIV